MKIFMKIIKEVKRFFIFVFICGLDLHHNIIKHKVRVGPLAHADQ
jgi:hypothetical protein